MGYCNTIQPKNPVSSCGCGAPPTSAMSITDAQASRSCGGITVSINVRLPDNLWVSVANVRQCKDATYIDLATSPKKKGGSGCDKDVPLSVTLSACTPPGTPIRFTDACLPKPNNIIGETSVPGSACSSQPSFDSFGSGCGAQRNKYC